LDFKVAKWTKNFKLLNLCGNLSAYVFVPSFLGENIPTAEFGMISAETACWDKEIFNEDFYLLLYLPICVKPTNEHWILVQNYSPEHNRERNSENIIHVWNSFEPLRPFKESRIDSKESIPPAYVACPASTTTRFLIDS
jgi:hypothetical protein